MRPAAQRFAFPLVPALLGCCLLARAAAAQPVDPAPPTNGGSAGADTETVEIDGTSEPGSGEAPPDEPLGRLPEPDPRARSVDSAAAESLFRVGKALLDEGKTNEACPKFEASFHAEPSGGTLLNLALCHQMQGRTASAWAEYRKAADMIRAVGQQERADEALRFALELEPRLSMISVTVQDPVPGLHVRRADVPIAQGAWGVPLPVDPGRHRIVATAPGYQSWTTDVDVRANADRRSVAVPRLASEPVDDGSQPLGRATAEDANAEYVAGLVMGATGLVAVGIGAVLGVVASNHVSEAKSDETLCGADRLCTPEGEDLVATARTEARASTLCIGIGAAMALSGVVLVLVTVAPDSADAEEADDTSTAEVALEPWLGPTGGGVTMGGRF